MKIKLYDVNVESKIAIIASIYLNISLIKNTTISTLGFFGGIENINTLIIDICLIGIPMIWYFVFLFFKGLSKYQVGVVLGWVLLYILTIIFGHVHKDFLIQGIIEGFTHIIAPALLISSLNNLDIFLTYLKKYIPIALYFCALRIFYFPNTTDYYYTFSYSIIIPMLLCLMFGLTESNKYLILSAFFLVFVFLYGARGPFLCVVFAFVFSSFFLYKNKRVLIISISVVIILICMFIFHEQIIALLHVYMPNSRTLGYLNGEWNDTYRSDVWKKILNEFINNPFAIHGCMSDRYFITKSFGITDFDFSSMKGRYAHNIFVELLYEFGMLGLVISILIIASIINNLIKLSRMSNEKELRLYIVFVSFFLGKMMISGSYLIDMCVGGYVGITVYFKNKLKNNRRGVDQ